MDNVKLLNIPILPGPNGQCRPCPELMTEAELIEFLRIPQISKAQNFHNVITHLIRFHGLPRIHICGQVLYPRLAIQEWIQQKTIKAQTPCLNRN